MNIDHLRPWWQLSGFTRTRRTDRFWRKVQKTRDPEACWPWLNGRSGSGYGVYTLRGKYFYAHRFAWELYHGLPVPYGKIVRHLCDNPLCCRPTHLAIGTHADNMADMVAHGRGRRHVLSADQVRELRRLHAAGTPCRELKARYGISQKAVHFIIRRQVYAHLSEVSS